MRPIVVRKHRQIKGNHVDAKLLTGLNSLRNTQQAWNSLWSRSAVTYAAARAENIDVWMKHFQPDRELKLATVWDQDRLVAALPLFENGKKFGMTVWSLTTDCWAVSGDLLLDPEYAAEDLCGQLVDLLKKDQWSLLKLESIKMETPRWQAFMGALNSKGHTLRQSTGDPIALTDVLQDWPAYQASWSGNHRAAVKKGIKRLNELGSIEVECFREGQREELNSILMECFQLEDRSWKGENGTSILKSDMQDFFQDEAYSLMQSGMLSLWQLKLDGVLIAFEYCAVGKGVVFSNKISFDPEYSRYSPGNVLRFYQHEFYQQDQQTYLFDMMGITCKNKAKWATRTYETGNVIVANGLVGSLALSLGNKIKPPADEAEPLPKLGAIRYLETADPQSDTAPELVAASV